jgi:hypothetical protein
MKNLIKAMPKVKVDHSKCLEDFCKKQKERISKLKSRTKEKK